MASVVEICNLALSRLGENSAIASIDPPEGSAQAEHCALFYPLSRDTLLDIHPWNFARRKVLLAPLDDDSSPWRFAYARPHDCLRTLNLLSQEALSEQETQHYCNAVNGKGTPTILTNQENASLVYTARVDDAALFPPLFIDALSWLLASHLAGPVIKGDAGASMAKICYQNFMLVLSLAEVSDTRQKNTRPHHTPQWINER